MRVAVTTPHGLVGTALVAELSRRGHTVTPLVVGPPGPAEATWDPVARTIEADKLEGHDGVVHLAGVSVGRYRWSGSRKRAVLDSRLRGTSLLARTLARCSFRPAVFVSWSSVSFYGDRGDEVLTESSECGLGFLPEVVALWEGAARPAADAGIRVVNARTGVLLTPEGGALKKELLRFKMGLGGSVGTGRQWLSWISIEDLVSALIHTLTSQSLHGPVNVTSPQPVTNADFAATLARVLSGQRSCLCPRSYSKAYLGGR